MEKSLLNPDTLTIDQILDALTPEVRTNPRIWPPALLELAAVLATHHMETDKLVPGEAALRAQDVVVVICHYLGGRNVYLPKGDNLIKAVEEILSLRAKGSSDYQGMFLKRPGREGHGWPLILLELVDALSTFYESRIGLGQKTAMKNVRGVITAMARHRGGRAFYMPRNDKLKLAIRDQAIYRAFDGSNYREISMQTKLTITRIYTIISQERSARQNGHST